MVTQRQIHDIALLDVQLDQMGSGIEPNYLTLSKDGIADQFTLKIQLDSYAHKKRVQIKVWKSDAEGFDEGDEVALWLTETFVKEGGSIKRLRLLRFCDDFLRKISAPRRLAETEQVMFADGYPLLVTSQTSLALLNNWIKSDSPAPQTIPMNRFRANIVLSGVKVSFFLIQDSC
jgi:uncharacterized protein YcbX